MFMTIFRRCLCDCNIDCWLRCVTCFKDGLSLKEFVHTHGLECVLGIHAWRAGRLLLGNVFSHFVENNKNVQVYNRRGNTVQWKVRISFDKKSRVLSNVSQKNRSFCPNIKE